MAIFAPALQTTLQYEGGYANIPGDSGGETYCGISRNNFPSNPLWPIIDKCKKAGPMKNNQIIGGADGITLTGIISDFYRIQFWDEIRGTDLMSQSVAGYLFDWHVNSGNIAIRQVQEMLSIEVDGRIGNESLQAFNKANPKTLWSQMVATRVQRAKDRVAHNPDLQKFLTGWLKRYQGFAFAG